jgi:hypothetical protein
MSALALVGILIWALFPTACGVLAFNKERDVIVWVTLGVLFCAFALVVIALLPSKNKWDVIERRAPVLDAPPAPPEPESYPRCSKCGRFAFTAAADGEFYCHACGENVQLAAG